MPAARTSLLFSAALAALTGLACAGTQDPGHATASVHALESRVVESTRAGGDAEGPAPLPATREAPVYTVTEALDDVLSGPLEFVGHFASPGLFQVLACAYRNDKVLVIDERCLPDARGRMTLHIYAPDVGRLVLWGRTADGAPLQSMSPSSYESFGVASYPPAPVGVEPAIRIGMSAVEMREHQEAMRTLGSERRRQGIPQEPACWHSSDQAPQCDRPNGSDFAASAASFVASPPSAWAQLLETMMNARRVARPVDASSPERLREIAPVYGRVHSCDVLERIENIGNTEGLFAPILSTGRNELMMVCAARRGGREVARVVRTSGREIVWSQIFEGPRGHACQARGLVEITPGEYALYSECGTRTDQARGHEHPRLTRFARDGSIRWTWVGGAGEHAYESAQRLGDGSFVLRGHLNPQDRSDAIAWRVRIGATGELLEREAGGPYVYRPPGTR